MKVLLTLLLAFTAIDTLHAQTTLSAYDTDSDFDDEENGRRLAMGRDSVETGSKEIPKGIRMWTVDKLFGDITRQPVDTVTHLFQNTVFTSGIYGDYNTLGNLGTPRINRIFADRDDDNSSFLFTDPYDFFITQPDKFLFTNTLSPYTNLSYFSCGNRTDGEDIFKAKFAVNAGKKFGAGFTLNYLYGRGYYSDQSTSLLNVNFYASYIDEQYQAHLLFTTNKIKIAENGGITDDYYVTHPESFDDNYATSEIPTMLWYNWNRNSNEHVFFTHRYSLGFRRKVKMSDEEIEARKFAIASAEEHRNSQRKGWRGRNGDMPEDEDEDTTFYSGRPDNAVIAGDDNPDLQTAGKAAEQIQLDIATADSLAAATNAGEEEEEEWMKTEFVPVTSFIHTLQLDTNERIYQAYTTPDSYYADEYYDSVAIRGDSIFDKTRYFRVRNTLAVSLLEGFNKWMFAGLKIFATSDLRHYTMPDEYNRLVSCNRHNLSIGGQMSRKQGTTFHYDVTAETCLIGDEQGQLKINGGIDLNFPLLGDTVSLTAQGFFRNEKPNYFLRHFHSQHFWWDDDLSMTTHSRIEGTLSCRKTHTALRFAADALTNYTYLAGSFTDDETLGRINNSVSVRQSGDAITLLTAAIKQDFTLGPLNWETVLTYQKSSKQDVLPVPALNVYSNLYLRFRIARVLLSELGGDVRYFTSYAAPDYYPGIGQFAVQENDVKTKTGNYPIVNVYANFNLKGTRFFVMNTHVNCGSGNSNYFLTPHYPLNKSVFRIGLSWNFFN